MRTHFPFVPGCARLLLVAFVLLLDVARAQVTTSVHALTGQPAPGASGFTWSGFFGTVIADDGEIAFTAEMRNSPVGAGVTGIWRGTPGNFSLVVRSGAVAPGAGAGATFESFGFFPSRGSDRTMKPLVFTAVVNNGTASVNSIWLVPNVANGALQKVAMEGDPAPGGGTIDFITSTTVPCGFDGSLTFVAQANGQPSIFSFEGGVLGLLARSSTAAPGLSQGTQSFGTNARPVMGDDTSTAFRAVISGGPQASDGDTVGSVLYDTTTGPVAPRIRAGDATQTGGVNFSFFLEPDITPSNNLAFSAQLRNAAGSSAVDLTNNTAICLGTKIVARKGEAVPDSGTSETFQHFADVVVANDDQVFFAANFVTPGNAVRTGLCLGSALGFPAKIAYEGDNPPGTPADVQFAPFGGSGGTGFTLNRAQINKAGQVVFAAIIQGTGVTPGQNFGLWASQPDGTLVLVAREGGAIEVSPGNTRTITDITFMGGSGLSAGPGDGRPSALNDAGQVVFLVVFSDDSSALVRANLGGSSKGSTSANFRRSANHADPVNTRVGELIASAVDLRLRGPMPLTFSRYYAARLAADGSIASALGSNWLSNFDALLTVNGDAAEAVTNEGRVMSFTKANNKWTLTAPLDIPFQLVQSGTNFILGDPRTQHMHTFDANGRLTKVEDGYGNAHTLTYDGNNRLMTVADGLGRALTLTYDAGGKLTSVGDGTRSVQYTYDGSGNLATVTDPLNHTTTYAYAAGALLTSTTLPRTNAPITQTFASGKVATQVEHPAGGDRTTAFAYDTAARTTTITDPGMETRVHTYTATGELAEFTDEEGNAVTLGSDATGRRSTVTDRLGRKTTIAYHAPSGKPASVTTPDGATTTFAYKARAVGGLTFYDLVKISYPDGTSRSFTTDAKGNVLTATDQLRKRTTFTYDARGRVLTMTNPTGGVRTYTYDALGNLATSKDSDTGTSNYTYDAFRRLTKLTHPDGTHLDLAYDAADRVTSLSDERGETFQFTYDVNDNVTGIMDAAGKTTQFGYDALDRVTQITDRLGKARSLAFDARGLLASETDELNHTTAVAHDSRRRVASVTEPGTGATTFGYDDEGRLTAITDALAHTSTFARNARGNVTAATDALGNTLTLLRDARQRITKIIDPIGRQTALSYDKRGALAGASRDGVGAARYTRDAAGRLTKIVDPNRAAWSFAYTTAGRVSASTDPLRRTTRYAYDTRGRLATITLPEGGTCTLARDAASHVTGLNFSAGPNLQYTYDDLGRVLTANGIVLTRDFEGQITNSAQASVNFSASYDDVGRLSTVGYGGVVTVTYAYDVNDRLSSVSDNVSGASVTFTRDAAGRLTGLTRSNGVNAIFTYDAADRLTRIQDGTLDLLYSLNAAGDVSSVNMTGTLPPAVDAGAKTFTYDAAAQVKTSGFTYDARGRLTATPDHDLEWDGASRLVMLDTTVLTYDGFGDVSTRTSGGTTTRFFHHHAIAGHPLVTERNEANMSFTRFHVWTPDGTLLYAIDAGTNAPSFYHFDRSGSTLALTNAAGTITDRYAWSPYGELLAREGTSTQPFTFIGAHGVRTEGPLYQMRARYYDPLTARFLSRDPAPPRLSDVRTLDPYLYALGNPLRFVDPDGAEPAEIGDAEATGTGLFGPKPRSRAIGFSSKSSTFYVEFDDPLPPTTPTQLLDFDTSVQAPKLPDTEVFNPAPRGGAQTFEEFLEANPIFKQAEAETSPADTTPSPASESKSGQFIREAVSDTGASSAGQPATNLADDLAPAVGGVMFETIAASVPVGGDAAAAQVLTVGNDTPPEPKKKKKKKKKGIGPINAFNEFKKAAEKAANKAKVDKALQEYGIDD